MWFSSFTWLHMHSKSIWIVTLHHCNCSKSHIFKLQGKANRASNKGIHFSHPASYRTHSEPLSLFAVWALLVCETCHLSLFFCGTEIFQLYWLPEVDPMTHLCLLYRTPAVGGGGFDTRGGASAEGHRKGRLSDHTSAESSPSRCVDTISDLFFIYLSEYILSLRLCRMCHVQNIHQHNT